VFPDHATAGKDLDGVSIAPRQLPPLADVASRLGIEVSYQQLPADLWGDCSVDGSKIPLGASDPAVFFHELAHAAHAHIDGRLKGGQHAHQSPSRACQLQEPPTPTNRPDRFLLHT
jgi:hypothetical protein